MAEGGLRSQLDDEASTLDLGHEPLEDLECLGVELVIGKIEREDFRLDRTEPGLGIIILR